jgi:hypothetical protein
MQIHNINYKPKQKKKIEKKQGQHNIELFIMF